MMLDARSCCLSPPNARGERRGTCRTTPCEPLEQRWACDDSADCGPTRRCCHGPQGGTSCAARCDPETEYERCAEDSQCAGGRCIGCALNGFWTEIGICAEACP